MRKVVSLTLIFFIQLSLYSQRWQAMENGLGHPVRTMYADTIDNYLYAGFQFSYLTQDGRTLRGIARWNGSMWDSLGTGVGGDNTLSLTRYNNKLYVGGAFSNLGNKQINNLGTWDGNNWDSIPTPPFHNYLGNAVWELQSINNKLYIGGNFDTVAGIQCKDIAMWDGITWSSLNYFVENDYGIFAIAYYNNELYVGGNFYDSLPGTKGILKYDGSSWTTVGGGITGGWSFVQSMVVYNNELYVAGQFTASGGNADNNIKKWNGNSWGNVGGGTDGRINKLIVNQNKLYAFGVFNHAGGIPAQNVAIWDGTNWCGLGDTYNNVANTGCFYNDTLFIGGGFKTIDEDTVNYIAQWIGGGYIDTCGNTTGIEQLNITNEAFIIYPNPTQSQLTIEFDLTETKNVSIEIKNILGQTVKTIDNVAFLNGKNKIAIDVNGFSNGLYFIQLQGENKILSKKFVKE